MVTGAERAFAQLSTMSFQDDAVEPLAIESAQHFTELLRRSGEREADEREADERGQRQELRRALPRELGN
jgi:hypothetical protein